MLYTLNGPKIYLIYWERQRPLCPWDSQIPKVDINEWINEVDIFNVFTSFCLNLDIKNGLQEYIKIICKLIHNHILGTKIHILL